MVSKVPDKKSKVKPIRTVVDRDDGQESPMLRMRPAMESATAMACCNKAASVAFILLVAPAWRNCLLDALTVLENAGAEVAAVDLESAIMRGRMQPDRLDVLAGLAHVASLAWRGPANVGYRSRVNSSGRWDLDAAIATMQPTKGTVL